MAGDQMPAEPKEPAAYLGWVDQLKGIVKILTESNGDLRGKLAVRDQQLHRAEARIQDLLERNSELRQREVYLEQFLGARPKPADIEAVELVLAFWKQQPAVVPGLAVEQALPKANPEPGEPLLRRPAEPCPFCDSLDTYRRAENLQIGICRDCNLHWDRTRPDDFKRGNKLDQEAIRPLFGEHG